MRGIILGIVLVLVGCRGGTDPGAVLTDHFVANCITSSMLHDECSGDSEQDYEAYCEDVLALDADRYPDCVDEHAAQWACEADLPCGWMTSATECAPERAAWRDCLQTY